MYNLTFDLSQISSVGTYLYIPYLNPPLSFSLIWFNIKILEDSHLRQWQTSDTFNYFAWDCSPSYIGPSDWSLLLLNNFPRLRPFLLLLSEKKNQNEIRH